MGEPGTSHVVSPAPEYIGCVEGTRGSETSQYPQEEKTNSDSVSSGERKRIEAKPGTCDTWQGLRVRGCGAFVDRSASRSGSDKASSLVEAVGKRRRRR
jgi:hypothetical protein